VRIEFEVPEDILHQLLDPVVIPAMARIRYDMPTPAALADIDAAVHDEMRGASGLILPGQRIAVGVGSRGLARLPEIVAALIRELRALGAEPFIIPTMGSHGGATAEGQREVLLHLGVTPERVGAPIQSSMETTQIGIGGDGTPVRLDRLALQSDGIVFVGRVKPHTAYRGTHESGLAKMIAIGLGKQAGAASCHAQGFSQMHRLVPDLAAVALARAPIRFGLAVLENAHDLPFKIQLVAADRILADEPALLDEARAAMPKIPFDQLDVLVIDRIGKDMSGDGADPNITGRYATPDASGGPTVTKQVVLDLTDATDGNANGLGTADFTTVHAARKMNLGRTYPNALTSTVAHPVALPMVLPSDRLAFAASLLTCNAVGREPRLMRIESTLQLGTFWVSSGLLDSVRLDPYQTIIEPLAPIRFDEHDDLLRRGGLVGAGHGHGL
jgi:Lactate racemase N-terminal domain